ncbi:hypothetical protein MarbSA_07250 [Methanobrevibacter arboriphilus]|uniref:Uncharacterized protein n=1 Tax=Methanobrevibacter arboriphilus TaxID=39441 RepID=A0ACA8R236_METAZ|nr:hypothetical protein MarbSA_07250 [Methanobrevibacter arboriphilus]
MNFYSNNGNISSVMFLNNTINATGGSGFYFVNGGSGAINVTDFIIKGNNIFATNAGLNFSGLKVGSLVNVTVEYNRIIAPVGVNITGFYNGSSFDFNWWGVNDITGKTLGVDTVNHFILNVTNLNSLDNLHPGDDVSFAFLVLNTTLVNDGVEYLPYFVVNGTYNNQTFYVNNSSNFTGNWTVSNVGDNVFVATLDSQDVDFRFSESKLDTNSTIIVNHSSVNIGENVTFSGQLANYTGISSVNVNIDGNTQSVNINSTGGWNLNYTTIRIGNITVTVSYLGNDNYNGFTNNTSFEVFKNSTNSTISVDNVHVGSDAFISGQLVGYVGDGSEYLIVSVDGNDFNVTIGAGGGWNLTYLTNRTGNITVTVSYLGNDNYTGFTNTTIFNVDKLATNSTINIPRTVKINQTVSISGLLTDQNDNPIANANLELIINGETDSYNITTNSDGVWNLVYTPNHSGIFDLSLNYEGDDRYNGFSENESFNVDKLATNSSINIPSDVKVGETITISGEAFDENNNPLADVSITVTVDGNVYTLRTDSDGFWSLKYKTTHTGKTDVKVVFNGNSNYFGFINNLNFNVKKNNNTNNTNHTNRTNHTNNTNYANVIGNSGFASMKKTGVPVIFVVLVLIGVFIVSLRRKPD